MAKKKRRIIQRGASDRGCPTLLGVVCREGGGGLLEDDLPCQLHVERLAGTDARRSVKVADSVADEAVRSDRAGSRRQVDAVEDVKYLGANLDSKALLDGDVLEN
jgi:hypothetical protein